LQEKTVGSEVNGLASTIVLFSVRPSITIWEDDPAQDNIYHLGEKSFSYSIVDENGNPISSFHHVKVTIKGGEGLSVDGKIDFKMPDTQGKGLGSTIFGFTVTDTDKEIPLGARVFSVSVMVDGPYPGGAVLGPFKVDNPMIKPTGN
jgi:hypothetical protein